MLTDANERNEVPNWGYLESNKNGNNVFTYLTRELIPQMYFI